MKNLFSFLIALLALQTLVPSQVEAQPNMLVNGDFETQYASGAPSHTSNIKNASSTYYDELPNWMTTTNLNAYTSNNATYVATNSTASYPLNPTQDFDPYTPHAGVGCVLLLGDHSHRFDGLITQQVSLTAEHTYSFSYYARRLAYSDQKNKLAFSIVYSNTVPGHDASATVNDLVPAPAVRMRSDFITLDQWVQVAGSFVAPTTGNAWVVLGFDNTDSQTDSNLPPPVSNTGSIHLVLDDVSLVDKGCLPPTLTYGLDLNTDNTCGDKTVRFTVSAQDRANNPGATFELTATGSNYVLTYGSADHSSCNIRVRNQSSFNVLATATNVCGTGPVFDTGTFTGRSFLDGCFTNATQSPTAATAYPNPATESLTTPQSAEQAVLLNGQGQAVQKPDASGKLRVQDLPAGLYNLQTLQNGKLVNQRIEVKH